VDSPQPTTQQQLDDHEERIAAIEGALRALVVVFSIRRMPDPPGGVDDER